MFDLLPFGNKNSMIDFFNNFDKDFFGDMKLGFNSDIIDKGDKYILQAELPGFSKEDINIDIDGDCLKISAEHKEENDEKDKDGNYIRRERRYGSFVRSFYISNVKSDQIDAQYNNGVLELQLPKKNPAPPREIKKIEIK